MDRDECENCQGRGVVRCQHAGLDCEEPGAHICNACDGSGEERGERED